MLRDGAASLARAPPICHISRSWSGTARTPPSKAAFMPAYRSRTTTHGRNMAGARGLWRATGVKDGDFGKPIIAIANSFTQFVPGHVHLKDLGQLVAREVEAAGGIAKEFNTIAVDDGIAMGHDGMLYSLPSREIIADSVEYMANAHCADALVCISNCDKITPGMLMAAMRLNIPAVFVSGGPMEAGKVNSNGKVKKVDLIDAMVAAADSAVSDEEVKVIERSACPTCGSCSGMFTANSMNCLTEALGLSLPGNGTIVATHADRRQLFVEAGHLIVDLARRWYEQEDASVLPRGIANFKAFENAMTLDIAMGGSTNTVLHLLAAAHEGGINFTMADIDRLSRRVPVLCKVAPSVANVHVEDVHRAGGVMGILGELDRAGLLNRDVAMVHAQSLEHALSRHDIKRSASESTRNFFAAAPGGVPTQVAFSQASRYESLDEDRAGGVIRDREHAFSQDGGLAVLYGNIAARRLHREDGGRRCEHPQVRGAGENLREPGRCGRTAFSMAASSRATSSSSATKVRAAARACRKCSIPRAISNRRASAKPARSSPTGGFPAARPAFRSAMSRPRRKRAAPSASPRPATASPSTYPPAR